MAYSIVSATSYGLHILSFNESGSVHSVYRKTINLSVRDAGSRALLSVQAVGSPLSPISLITNLNQDEMAEIGAAPGQRVEIQGGKIRIFLPDKPCVFVFGRSKVWETALENGVSTDSKDRAKNDLVSLERVVRQVLVGAKEDGFQPLFRTFKGEDEEPKNSQKDVKAEFSPVLSTVKKILDRGRDLFYLGDYESSAAVLTGLLGLGMGLTPSGDDFLSGLLAGLRLGGQGEHPFALCLKRQIKLHLEDTNDISAAFLLCALDNQFSQAVTMLQRPLVPAVSEVGAAFGSIGHSSGIDTLCGVLFGLTLLF